MLSPCRLLPWIALLATCRLAAGAAGDYRVDGSFSSHLPLLILSPLPSDGEGDSVERLELRLVANAGGDNRPDGPPTLSTRALWEGEGSAEDGKLSGALRLIDDGGGERAAAPLGMPAAAAWTVVGAELDRMLLHNALGRRLAGAVTAGPVPEARYCEVLVAEGDGYRYQGLHLLSEYVREGIWLSPRAMEDTRALARHEAGKGYARVDAAPGADDAFPGELERIAASLRSTLPSTYLRYMERLDIAAFIDTYIVALALMDNPRAAPFYWHKNRRGGTIGITPLWDFTHSLDNLREAVEGQVGLMARYPWLDDLLRSSDFIERLKRRYFDLRRGALAPERLEALVDDLVGELGPAMARDWRRWEAVYVPADADRVVGVEQEVLKIRHYLRMQGDSIQYTLLQLHLRPGLVNSDLNTRWNSILAVSIIAFFLLLAAYCRNRF